MSQICSMSTQSACPLQIVALEKSGGTILGGAIKLIRDKKKNPGPPRDPSLPPKPKGQTVGSFTGGLRMLPEAIAHKMHNKLRLVPVVSLPPCSLIKMPGHDYCYQGNARLHRWPQLHSRIRSIFVQLLVGV